MHIELRHLKTIREIHRQGGLARAAEVLNITQSALSHQIKGIEDQAGVELFVRPAKPLRLSAAGHRMLRLAERILPEIEGLEEEFRALRQGKTGRLHIAIECHACFDWLLPTLSAFRRAWPDVDVDIRPGLAFTALPALARAEVDLVISSDPEAMAGITFHPLFDYEPQLVAAASNPLADKAEIAPDDLRDQMLITYPMDRGRLDVFTEFLGLREAKGSADYVTKPLAGRPVKRLYAAVRDEDAGQPFMAHFLRLGRTEPVKLQRAAPDKGTAGQT
jgi:LysR family transcriptional regulator for metE and metH